MIIRDTHHAALRRAGAVAFEHEMVEHLAQYAPKLYELHGSSVFRRLVRDGIERAQTLGFTFRGPMRMILECMVTFGVGFDTDPLYPGIRAALAERTEGSHEMDRAESVHQCIRSYWTAVVGNDGSVFMRALKRIRTLADRAVAPRSFDELLGEFRWAYPERVEYATDEGMRQLMNHAIQAAQAVSIPPSSETITLITSLMFGFGHEVLRDPLYPWVRTALEDPNVAEPEERILRLHSRARVYIDNVDKYWSRRAG